MAIHADWGGAHNKEEEERKKRTLGVGASLGKTVPKPTVAETPKKQTTTFDIRETPTSQIKSIVAKQQAKPQTAASPLAQYFKMVITDGADAVTDRIKKCTSIWRRYYEPYDGPSTVWSMVSSNYTVPELEKLAVYGHGVLFNQNRSNKANYLPNQGGDGTKDGDMLRIATGVRASVGGRMPWQESGYRPAVDIEYAAANPDYAENPDFQTESAFMTAKEGWADEFSQANPLAVSNVEELTGIKRADFVSWRDWLDKVQQWGRSGDINQEIESNKAISAFTAARDEWNRENHSEELKQHRWFVGAELAKNLATATGVVMTAGGIGSWAALGLAGKGFTALGAVGFSGMYAGQAGFDPNESAQRLADKQKAEFEGGELKTAAQQRFDDYMATMNHAESVGDREYIKKIQADLQQPVVAEDGSIVRPALGVGLQAEGILDATWRGVIEQAADYNIRSGAELQYQLISGGYATDDMEVTGVFEALDPNTGQWVPDEKWTRALKKAQDDWAGQTKMAEDHPTLYTFLKSFGMPMTEAGWSALGTKLVAEGYAYAPLKALVQSSYAVGGVFNSVPAMIENYAIMSKDAKLTQLKEELTAMVKDRMPVADPETLPFDAASPEDITSAKAQLLVESGIVTDEAAVAKAQEISQRELDLVSLPSYGWVGMFGYLTSSDTEKTRAWLTENYNKVHAFNMAIDLVGQAAVGRVTKLIGAGVGRTPERFLSNNAIERDLARVTELANDGDFGNVASLVGGTDARIFARDLYRYRNQAERFTVSAPITKAKSEFVSEAARAGNRDGVLQALGAYGKTPAGIAYADRLLTMTGKKQIGSAPATIARAISKRQATTGDIWGTRDVTPYVRERATDMWSGTGQDGRYYDLFPQHMAKDIDSNSYVRISMERAIAGITNDSARKAASAIVLPTYRAPVHSYSSQLVDFPNRVADWVGAITNDMSMVIKWRTKAALTDFSQPRAAARFEAELMSLRPVYLVGARGRQSLAGKMARELVDPRKMEAGGEGQLTGLKISGPAGEEAQFVGRYKEGGEQREAVMATSQLKHEVYLGRDVMLAEKVLPNVDGFVPALGYAFTKATNLTRRFERGMTTIATPTRVVSVGAGAPVLFQKHSFADTGRTLTDIGAAALAKFGTNRKFYETTLAKVSPQVSQRVAFERKVAIETEQHYQLDGGIEVTRQARKTFDDRGRPKNMEGAIDTVRHIVSNKAYEAFVAGGQEGLEAWVATPEGGKFLTASGQTRKARALLKEMGEKPTAEAIRQTAATNFVNESLELFGDYAQLPYLSKVMREMAAGRSAATPDAIRKAIMNAYKHGENPTVDVPIDTGESVVNWFAKATKVAMTPNRLNREAVFNHVFEKIYSNLTGKQGLPPNDAAIIASTVARTKTAEVHFDLSYGMRFEMKHRWVAYFGTKHRLWNTWLVQAAVKHPGYAAAINEYANWMQERNEQDDSVSEWDKHSLVVDIGKRRFQINLASYAWLMDYAIESPFANLIENGVFHTVNLATGTDLKPAPDSFGFSLTRFDPMVSTVWRLIHAPLRDGTEADWKKYIEELPEKEREKFSKDVSTIYGIAKQSGENISVADACKQVLLGNIAHEAYRFLKPASSKLIDEGHTQLLKDAQEFAQVAGTPESSKWLALHPSYAMTIGAGTRNPFDQAKLTAALSTYQSIKERYAQEVVNAFDRGDLEDPEYATWLYNQEQAEIRKLEDTVPIFKSWMDYNGEDTMTFGERAHYAFPSITKEQWEEVSVPPYEEQQLKRQELETAFEKALEPFGFVASQNIAAVKMLRHQYIDIPMAAFLGALPGDLTAAVKNNARILATASKNGFVRSTQYVEMMTNAMKRQMLLSGTRLNSPDNNNLLMAMLSPAEKQYVGVATDDTAEEMWFTYALRRAAIEAVTGAADKGTASTIYKQMTQALDDEVESEWLGKSKTFEEQWAFSKLPLHLRLDFMHFGEGETPEAEGWSDCIEIVSRYHSELANTYNKTTGKLGVGPTSASAAKVVRKYLGQLVSLSEKNKEWYADWKLMGMGPSKFGFPLHWRLTDGSDYDLWAGDDQVPDEDFIDIYGE